MSNQTLFLINGVYFEYLNLTTMSLGMVNEPAAGHGPRLVAQVRKEGAAEWVKVPSAFEHPEEAIVAARDFVQQNFEKLVGAR